MSKNKGKPMEAAINNDDWKQSIQELQRTIIESRMKQDEFNKESVGSHQKILEKLESMENQLTNLKNQINPVEEPVEKINESVDSESDDQEPQQEQMVPLVAKQFVLKHTFKNVSEDLTRKDAPPEEFFGVKWFISIGKEDEKFGMYLHCRHLGKWSIMTHFDLKLIRPTGEAFPIPFTYCFEESLGRGRPECIGWSELINDYLIDGELKVEAHVRITKMSGVYKDDFMSFDDMECSDIVLIVDDMKFYFSKLFLASRSPYFKAMFLGMFGESKKSEIKLSGVDADDFQKYLEVVYGEPAIDEFTVEGILLVADMFDTPIVTRKCEEFLQKESGKTLKKKLELSVRYHLGNLKIKCLAEMKTVDDIRSILPSNFRDMDPSIIADLLEISLAL